MALDALISPPTRTSYQGVRYLKDGGSPRRGDRSSLITFAQRDPRKRDEDSPFDSGIRGTTEESSGPRNGERERERERRGVGERALSSTDKRQITRLSSCHLRNRKKPFRVSLDSGRRTPDVLWISFFLSQKSRKLGRVKSSFHGPRGHTEGEQRMNAASKIRSARLWFGSVLHTWSYYLFPEKSAFPPSFASSFREQSLTFAAIFFKVMGKTRRNRNPRNHRCNLVEPGRLYRLYVRSENRSKSRVIALPVEKLSRVNLVRSR